MSNLWLTEDGKYTGRPGSDIKDVIQEAIALSAEQSNRIITFKFNDVTVNVRSDSDPKLIYRDWQRATNGMIDTNVGPHPKRVLTREEIANDNRISAELDMQQRQRERAYHEGVMARRNVVESKLVNAPPIEVVDEREWRKLKRRGPYELTIIAFAERWARLIQLEMAEGKTLEEVAEAASYEADFEDITGLMYGAAATVLVQCWKHGEQFRRWHNLNVQVGKEGERANETGGILNPALMRLTIK